MLIEGAFECMKLFNSRIITVSFNTGFDERESRLRFNPFPI